ncbi:MAG: endonuclease V [Planctomycetota bacterium]
MHPRQERVEPEVLARWKEKQEKLASRVITTSVHHELTHVAGVDCAFAGDAIVAVAVLWDVVSQDVVRVRSVRRKVTVPYRTGFLSFREGQAVHEVLDRLGPFDAAIFDGQGLAHPRRCGLATHIGVERDIVAVGCAKSRLVGEYVDPPDETGIATDLVHRDEVVGRVIRTREGTKPVFVSIGHRCELDQAAAIVLATRRRYRLPEPTRLADKLVAKAKLGEVVDFS